MKGILLVAIVGALAHWIRSRTVSSTVLIEENVYRGRPRRYFPTEDVWICSFRPWVDRGWSRSPRFCLPPHELHVRPRSNCLVELMFSGNTGLHVFSSNHI